MRITKKRGAVDLLGLGLAAVLVGLTFGPATIPATVAQVVQDVQDVAGGGTQNKQCFCEQTDEGVLSWDEWVKENPTRKHTNSYGGYLNDFTVAKCGEDDLYGGDRYIQWFANTYGTEEYEKRRVVEEKDKENQNTSLYHKEAFDKFLKESCLEAKLAEVKEEPGKGTGSAPTSADGSTPLSAEGDGATPNPAGISAVAGSELPGATPQAILDFLNSGTPDTAILQGLEDGTLKFSEVRPSGNTANDTGFDDIVFTNPTTGKETSVTAPAGRFLANGTLNTSGGNSGTTGPAPNPGPSTGASSSGSTTAAENALMERWMQAHGYSGDAGWSEHGAEALVAVKRGWRPAESSPARSQVPGPKSKGSGGGAGAWQSDPPYTGKQTPPPVGQLKEAASDSRNGASSTVLSAGVTPAAVAISAIRGYAEGAATGLVVAGPAGAVIGGTIGAIRKGLGALSGGFSL